MSEIFHLSAADYIIFILLLVMSSSIGLYFLVLGRKQKTTNEYLLGERNMSILPVSFSLMASFMSATNMLGIPAEMYVYGTNMIFMNIGFILGPTIASVLFLPIYFKTGISTSFEYLEKRFGKLTRRILSVIFLFQSVLFGGIALYAPALALSAVTNLSTWTSIISIGVVCTFYCTVGGIRAVIWTDVIQSLLMYTCLFSIVIKGCLDLGGIQSIFETAFDGGRILIPTFKMDFSVRYTIWSILLQGVIITTAGFVGDQIQVQRHLTLKTLKRSKIACLLSIPMLVSFQLLCSFCGLIFYAYFQSCDPVASFEHPIESHDQLMPYYITTAMNQYPGVPGLCIAGIFSASLSTISSAVHSMATVTYEDIFRPLWPNFKKPLMFTKIASIFYGVLIMLVTFLITSMGNLVKSSILVIGMVAGPLLGVFLLASLTTTANEMGVNIGVIAGFVVAGCITFIPNEKSYPSLPVQTNCTESYLKQEIFLMSTNLTDESVAQITPSPNLTENSSMSFMWITPLSFLVCVVTGYIGSWCISCIRGTCNPVPPELLSPIRQRFYVKSLQVQKCPLNEKFFEDLNSTHL